MCFYLLLKKSYKGVLCVVPLFLCALFKKDKSDVFSKPQYLTLTYIFVDLYEWAGQIRTIDIYKEEAVLCGVSLTYGELS